MEVLHILEWLGYTVCALLVICALGYTCWRYYKQNYIKEICHPVIEVVASSSTTSSQGNAYFSSPKKSYEISPEVNDGLSEFDYSIMVDQPMILTNKRPFCHQKAIAGMKSETSSVNNSSSSSVSKPREREYFLKEQPEKEDHCAKGIPIIRKK